MVEIKAADLEVRCFFAWRMKGHIRFDGSVWKMGTRDWGFGTWAVLSSIPEG